jgi:hypothetical protein
MTIATERAKLQQAIADQRRWIEDHGNDRAGYVARYGPASGDPTKPISEGGRYGDGGEVIYAADVAELRRLTEQDARLLARQNSRRP